LTARAGRETLHINSAAIPRRRPIDYADRVPIADHQGEASCLTPSTASRRACPVSRAQSPARGETLMAMVAHDAFTHILTNPLLAHEVHCPDVYSEAGMAWIEQRSTFAEVAQRACEDEPDLTADFRAPGWRD